MYGSMIWYVLPIKEGVSWEGHLSGLITGLLFAIVLNKEIAKPKKYVWEEEDYDEDEDPFLKHFDENGNFIEYIEEDNTLETKAVEDDTKINYVYRKSSNNN